MVLKKFSIRFYDLLPNGQILEELDNASQVNLEYVPSLDPLVHDQFYTLKFELIFKSHSGLLLGVMVD